jgi:hypothetical protein
VAQTTKPDSSEILKQLLSLPAPPPRITDASTNEPAPQPTQKPVAPEKPPADDAPIEDLKQYWDRHPYQDKTELSRTITQRLFNEFLAEPDKLVQLLPYLTPAEAEKLKSVCDQLPNDEPSKYLRDKLREWLVANSKYYVNELLAQANKVKDDPNGGYVDKATELTNLAKVDFSTAEPLLQRLAETGQPRSSALALSLLYQHSIDSGDSSAEDKFRTRLQAIAADRSTFGRAREIAIDALSITKWSGRDDWYLTLLQDETLIQLHDGSYGFSPLDTIVFKDPDKWIPIMTKLVGGTNRTVQQAAASCLVRYATQTPRRDAILPVLRWLSEPDWIPINDTERAWFMQKMDELEIPESVPGLIWIIENDEYYAKYAARTIAHYKDARAIPALKKALLRSTEDNRVMILDGLLASGGITEAEAIDALEQYAAKLNTPEGREEVDRYFFPESTKLTVPLSIGRYLATRPVVPPEIVRAVLAYAARIRKQNPELSRSLLLIAQRWESRDVDLTSINRIAAGTADAETIANALGRRDKLRESLATELQLLLRSNGIAPAVGSILLDDKVLAQTILSSGDQQLQIAVLASARLTQTSLPVAVVGPMMTSKNAVLAQAAERYLLAEDSDEAQTALWQHHRNEGFITGWRDNSQFFSFGNFEGMEKKEDQLRAELLKENGPAETFALLSDGAENHRVLRVYADRAVYTYYEDSARYRERVISKTELSVFNQFLADNNFEGLGPQFGPCHHDCWTSELLVLRKEGGRRVFSHQGFSGWNNLLENLDLLGRGPGAKYHYAFEAEIKGREVLYAEGDFEVKEVWQQGDDLRVYTERAPTEEEIKGNSNDEADELDDDDRDEQRRRREAALQRARFSWRKISDGKIGDVVEQPKIYDTIDRSKFSLEPDDETRLLNSSGQLRVSTPDSIIIARNFEGLWKQVAGTKAVRISEKGAYVNPVTTPDGKWVVVAKTDDHWGIPNYVVRFNIETGREYRINLEPGDEFGPIIFLRPQQKVLLRRVKKENLMMNKSDPPEFFLLTPDTGETQSIAGEFAPLLEEGNRTLQPTGKPDEFWAAIRDGAKEQTKVGRYNLKTFSFTPELTIPHIWFDSMSMWVDEKHARIYVAYKGQLLSIPLRSAAE